MAKFLSNKRQAVKVLKFWINQSRKIARQVNRKLDSLAEANKMKEAARQQLIKIWEAEQKTEAGK